MKKRLFINLLLVCLASIEAWPGGLRIYDLRVESTVHPVGIDRDTIRLSWKLKSPKNGIVQTYYRYEIFEMENGKPSGSCLKSAKVRSAGQHDICVDVCGLSDDKEYGWQVTCWADTGEKATSDIALFHMGIRDEKQMKAQWIWTGNERVRTPYFRKKIQLKAKVKDAYLYITGQGYYCAYLNDRKIGNAVLAPLPSQAQYRIYYDVYKVAELLDETEDNVLGVVLGEGQTASTDKASDRFSNKARTYPGMLANPALWAQLMVTYESGEKDVFVSDSSWQWGVGPIQYNSFYGGETVDARIEVPWCRGRDFSDWRQVRKRNIRALMTRSYAPEIKVMDRLSPVRQVMYGDSLYLYDLGQNIGGYWAFTVQGMRGTKLTVTASETLNESDFPKKLEYGDRLSANYTHGLGGYYERDTKTEYILSGDGQEYYEPFFFYSGFRYIQVKVEGEVWHLEVQGCAVHCDMPLLASFECSEPLFNRLHQNTVWSIKGIAQGAPMSNPNSEKYGWTGDAHLYAEPAIMLFDSRLFWEKWLDDIRDGQLAYATGNVINTIPNYRKDIKTTSATWGAAYPLCVWYNYCFYEDSALLRKHYRGLDDWCAHLDALAEDGLVKGVWGDHVPPGFLNGEMITRGKSEESSELVASVYYHVAHSIQSRIASVLDKPEEEALHRKRAETIADAINRKYLDKDRGYYVVENTPEGFHSVQTVNAIPLQYGIVPEAYRQTVLQRLVRDIKEHGCHLTTGIMGTKALVDVLPYTGHEDLFWQLSTRDDYPGWGFWVRKGATTHWQHWSGFPDHNHAMYGSIENFIVSQIGGIRMATLAGIPLSGREVIIEPKFTDRLDFVNCSLPTLYGDVRCNWKKAGGVISFEIEIPIGLSARFIFREEKEVKLKSGRYKLEYFCEDADVAAMWDKIPWNLLLDGENGSPHQVRRMQTWRIEKPREVKVYPSSCFRASVEIADCPAITKAEWYMAGIGYHICYLNGKLVSGDRLTPSPTSYDKCVLYKRYDVTPLLAEGRNVFATALGNGFLGQNVAFTPTLAYAKPMMKCFLKIIRSDGCEELKPLDEWKASTGPVVFDNVYAGETRDSRIAGNWAESDYDDRLWKPSQTTVALLPEAVYELDAMPAVSEVRSIKPLWVRQTGGRRFLVDFGENIAGVVRMRLDEPEGREVRVTYGEVCRKDGKLDLLSTGIEATGVPQTDIFIANGSGVQEWMPEFTYHGFRYVEVAGVSVLPDDWIEAVVLHNDFAERMTFECSDSTLNRIYEVSCRTLASNMHGIPEDCPHREKCAWLGDAHLVAEFAMMRYRSAAFWKKYCRDIHRELEAARKTDPTMVIPGKRTCGEATFDWGCALIFIPWYIYEQYADLSSYHLLYPYMKEYVRRVYAESQDGIVVSALGDWCPPLWDRKTNPDVMDCPPQVSATALYCHALRFVQKGALLSGETLYADSVARLRQKVEAAFHDSFFVEAQGKSWYGSQTGTILALQYNLVPETLKEKVAASLVTDMCGRGWHHNAGVFGLRHVYSLLADCGYPEVAYKLMLNPTFPSPRYTLEKGLTTWPERQWKWVEGVDFSRSLNHLMHTGFTSFLYEHVLGICRAEGTVGYRNLEVRPFGIEKVEWAKGGIHTDSGRLNYSWSRTADGGKVELYIPEGCEVRMRLPHGGQWQVAEGGSWRMLEPVVGDTVCYDLPAGRHQLYVRCEGKTSLHSVTSVTPQENFRHPTGERSLHTGVKVVTYWGKGRYDKG